MAHCYLFSDLWLPCKCQYQMMLKLHIFLAFTTELTYIFNLPYFLNEAECIRTCACENIFSRSFFAEGSSSVRFFFSFFFQVLHVSYFTWIRKQIASWDTAKCVRSLARVSWYNNLTFLWVDAKNSQLPHTTPKQRRFGHDCQREMLISGHIMCIEIRRRVSKLSALPWIYFALKKRVYAAFPCILL